MSGAIKTREETIIESAKDRRDFELNAYRSLMRQLYGDEPFWEEVAADERHFIAEKHKNPPPPKSVRERLKRWYGWSKRG